METKIEAQTPETPQTQAAPEILANHTFSLSEEQKGFIEAVLDSRQNVLLVGKAGTGKSTAVRLLCEEASLRGISFARLAPTGKAAINIGGETVHRFISHVSSWRTQKLNIQFVLIDEISMVRADLLDQLDGALRAKLFNNLPFGGLQLVFVGDPGQLPPVLKKDDGEAEYIKRHYHTHHFFGAAGFARTKWTVLWLTKIFRQQDDRFPRLLNQIRDGKKEKPITFLNKFRVTNKPRGVILTGRNQDADLINQSELRRLDSLLYTYHAAIEGEIAERDYPAERHLDLKVGARVMVIKNVYRQTGRMIVVEGASVPETELILYNGDTGTVNDLSANEVFFTCDRTGLEETLTMYDGIWTHQEGVFDQETGKLEYKVKGSFSQIPLRLAYAVTIHKAQGATITGEVTIDLRKPLFCPGQAYVAFSRATSLDNVFVLGKLRPRDIQTDPEVMDFLEKLLESQYVGIKPGSQFDVPEEASQPTAEEKDQLTKIESEEFARMFEEDPEAEEYVRTFKGEVE